MIFNDPFHLDIGINNSQRHIEKKRTIKYVADYLLQDNSILVTNSIYVSVNMTDKEYLGRCFETHNVLLVCHFQKKLTKYFLKNSHNILCP